MGHDTNTEPGFGRRGILATLAMAVGLIAGYGLGLKHFFEYLVPLGRRNDKRRMFIGTLGTIPVGTALTLRDPAGQEINVARTADDRANPAAGFKALSSKCPHLGCKVHWSAGPQQFVCPCHNGVFDKEGRPLSGPPAAENKWLSTYEVQVDDRNGWVFVMVSSEDSRGA